MSKHQKRNNVPKTWPIPRKGTTFVVSRNSIGIPILVVLRDMLKIAKNKKEVKIAIHRKMVLINNKKVVNEKKSMELFDVLTLTPTKKNYRLTLNEKGKYSIEEISEKDSKIKISKIIGKKTTKNKKQQINLYDSRNYLSDLKCKVGDSIVLDLDKNKILKVLSLKEKAKVLVINGKHAGRVGVIEKLLPEKKLAQLVSEKESFNVLIKQMMVIE